jgi:glucuronoarabinoxylan endo-1,4-beta-xylanase
LSKRALALFLAATGCTQQSRFEPTLAVATERATTAPALVVDRTRQKQTITGFGASSAWNSGIMPEQMDLMFDQDQGIGLSLLRMHIAPDGTTSETGVAKLAIARGAKVWAAPWSPPGEWKDNGSDTNGGSLLSDFYQDWADRLTGFVLAEKAAGVPLLALSVQNEPNWSATWETCTYTADELTTFVRDYLAASVARDCPDVKLLAPETADWSSLSSFADPLLADPGAAAALGIIAVHDYGGTPYAYAAPAANGKEFWETEVSYDDQTGIDAALETARQIHLHLTVGGMNAFHYWWLVADQNGKGGLLVNGALSPQAYALGHFSKFVRPGYVRLDVAATPADSVYTSAYADPDSDRVVLVLVNQSDTPVDLSLQFTGHSPVAFDPWLTTADVSLAEQAPVSFRSPLTYSLPAASITTLVSLDALPPPPPPPPPNGEGGQAGDANGGVGAGGASGAAGEGSAPATTGGSVSTGSGGAGSTRSSGGHSSSHGGSHSTPAEPSEAGAPDDLDGGIDDGDGGTPRRVPGLYSACLCRLPGGDHGEPTEAAPFVALLAFATARRRARARRRLPPI